jgi:hypothetical protein
MSSREMQLLLRICLTTSYRTPSLPVSTRTKAVLALSSAVSALPPLAPQAWQHCGAAQGPGITLTLEGDVASSSPMPEGDPPQQFRCSWGGEE